MTTKSFIKNILFAFVFFSLIIILSFSGCISFCSVDSSEDKECISYAEAIELCDEISTMPQGYPICADFSKSTLDKMVFTKCDSEFSNSIAKEQSYSNLTLNTQQLSNQFRQNVFNGWKSSDTIALGYGEVNKTCSSFLNGDFVKYKKKIKTESQNLDNYNKQTIASFLGSIYSTKKDLQDINIDLVQDTLLYKDYIELNAILNEFQKALGNDIIVKESLAKDTIYFYVNYYGNSLSNNELSNAISSLSASDASTETNADIAGWATAIGAVLGLSLINPPAAFIASLTKGFNLSQSISSQVSDVLENASQKTNLSEWRKLNVLKNMLIGFSKAHGKYSYSDKAFFELLNNMDKHISEIKTNNLSFQKSLLEQTNKLLDSLDEKIIEKSKYNVLYEKYKIIESPYDLQAKLIQLQNKLKLVNLFTVGEQHHYLISYSSEFNDMEKQINNYMNSDYESLLSLCTADFMNLKPKMALLPESQDNVVLQNYIDLFFSTKDDTKKLIYCANVFSTYSDANSYSCLSSLSNLITNSGLNFDTTQINEKICEQIIYSKLADAKNTENYLELESLFSKLNTEIKILKKLSKYPICLSDKVYFDTKSKSDSYYLTTKYSDDVVLNLFLSDINGHLISELTKYLTDLSSVNASGIKCYFEHNYEYDLDNSKLIFNNIFGSKDILLDISLSNYGIIAIENKDCLLNSKITIDKLTLDFKCLASTMAYEITFKDLEIKTSIQKLTVDSSSGYLETKVCLPNQNKTNYLVALPINEDKIISVVASKNSSLLPAEIIQNKLSLLFNSITNSETCVLVNYTLETPVYTNITLNNISEDPDNYIYNYDLNIKNELYLTIPKLKVLLDLPSNYESKNISLNSISSSNITDKDLPYITLLDVFGLSNLNYKYSVKVSKDLNVDSEIDQLYNTIISLRQYSIIPEYTVKNLLNELDEIKLISDTKAKLKNIALLKKEIDKLIADAKTNELYVNSYNLTLSKLQKNIENYKLTISKLKSDYNISISGDLDLDLITAKIDEAKELYNSGDVKAALSALNAIKLNFKSIEDYISNIFNAKTKKTKDLLKKAGNISEFDNEKFSDIDRIGFDVSQKLSSGDYLNALESISQYDSRQSDIEKTINVSISNIKSSFKTIFDKYTLYKKGIDSLWSDYSLLDSQLNSEHYDTVKGFGISFSFTSSNLTPIKTKITSITKDLIDLDKLSQSTDYLNLDSSKFDEFFYSFDSIDDSLGLYQKEMRSKALNEITVAAGKAPSEIEFYKAKDNYDSNNFVDAIYYAKVSQLGSKSQSSTDYTLYIGLGFIALLVVLVLVFGKKLSFASMLGKPKDYQKKETYYSVEREE